MAQYWILFALATVLFSFYVADAYPGSKCPNIKLKGATCEFNRDGRVEILSCECDKKKKPHLDQPIKPLFCDKRRRKWYYTLDGETKKFITEWKCGHECDVITDLPEGMVASRNSTGHESSNLYIEGDQLLISCLEGYIRVLSNFSEVDSLYDMYTSDDTFTNNLICQKKENQENGTWNVPLDERNYGLCKQITCDASPFLDIGNGEIVDKKEVYLFGEVMTLKCYEGYKPKSFSTLLCENSYSFLTENFGCEPITCPDPPAPFQGIVEGRERIAGSNVTFKCDGTLYGKDTWVCQNNGKWDGDCVICLSNYNFCPPPCIPMGAQVTTDKVHFSEGSKIVFSCRNTEVFNSSVERTCLSNGMWSGDDIDCLGTSNFNPMLTWTSLTNAMEGIINKAYVNESEEDTGIEGKSLNKQSEGGTDLYFLLDVSKSIDENMFNRTKRFVKSLLPKVGISNSVNGTRVCIMLFASESWTYFDGTVKKNASESYEDVSSKIDNITLTMARKHTQSGTAIATAFDEIETDITTKESPGYKDRKATYRAVVIISDGVYTTKGNPVTKADRLKNKRSVEIYSIFIGKSDEMKGQETMRGLASVLENEQHYFAIKDDDDELEKITQSMIYSAGIFSCGETIKALTSDTFRHKNQSLLEQTAKKGAWPWMVQILKGNTFQCGGTLIEDNFVLTAAHCLDDVEEITLIFRSIEREARAELSDVATVLRKDCIIHDQYDKKTFHHDIALIPLVNPIVRERDLLPICWKSKENVSSVVFKPGTFGQTLGWGNGSRPNEKLQQNQMPIRRDNECLSTSIKEQTFNGTIMFCAGGKTVENKDVDTQKGDSGGPFMLEDITKPAHYYQVGIVSSGTPSVLYGYYTNVSAYEEWIENKMRLHAIDKIVNV